LSKRRFHPWEGGEGLVSGQFVWSHVILGLEALNAGHFAQSLEHFEAARHYPENLGEGKHLLTPENHLDYFAGLALLGLRDNERAKRLFEAATAQQPVLSPMSYYRAMAYQEIAQPARSRELLNELVNAASKQMDAEVTIDYFATSLPNFLLFEDDLQKRNRIECLLLMGMAQRGLERPREAQKAFEEVLALDPSHLPAQQQLQSMRSPASTR
jgi:tetratricopeptide (TPR) repeat protein